MISTNKGGPSGPKIKVDWELPAEIIERINERARLAQCPPEVIVSGVLSILLSVPVGAADLRLAEVLGKLSDFGDETLREMADAPFPEARLIRLSALLALNHHGSTTPQQEAELQQLLEDSRQHTEVCQAARRLLSRRQNQIRTVIHDDDRI